MSTIELRGVAKRFGATPVLTDVDLVVPDGTTTAVLGESGSGKTTLLRLIAGFEQVDAGTVSIDGRVVDDGVRSVRAQHRGVGYVPQEGALFPHLTVAGNVSFGLPRGDRSRAKELIELVGLGGLGRRYPHQLSGGQQQRVALARALTIRPSVVLLDEPFSSLDASLRAEVRGDVARVLAETATTTVLVTHDQDEALALADRIAVLRQGRMVVSADPHELYRDPPDLTAATSLGEANILASTVSGNTARCVLGTIRLHDHGPGADGPAHLLLRPEQLVLHVEPNHAFVGAVVVDAQFHGHDTLVDLVTDGPDRQALLARVPGDLVLRPGQPVGVEVRGHGRVWSVDHHVGAPRLGPVDSHVEDPDASLWLSPDPVALTPAATSPDTTSPLPVPGPAQNALQGPAQGATPGAAPPSRRAGRLVGAAVIVVGAAVLVAVLLLGGGSSPAAVGPVVFHGSIALSGEFHTRETFTDASTGKKARSCAAAAAHGDRPSMGPDTWIVPTPPINNTVEIEIGTAVRLPRPRRLRPGRAHQGQRGHGRRTGVLRHDGPRRQGVDDGQRRRVGPRHVRRRPRRRRQSPSRLARRNLRHHRLDLHELR